MTFFDSIGGVLMKLVLIKNDELIDVYKDEASLKRKIRQMSRLDTKDCLILFYGTDTIIPAWKFVIRRSTVVYSTKDQFYGTVTDRFFANNNVYYSVLNETGEDRIIPASELEKICKIRPTKHPSIRIPFEHPLYDSEVVITKATKNRGLAVFGLNAWSEYQCNLNSLEPSSPESEILLRNLRFFIYGSCTECTISNGILDVPISLYHFGRFQESIGLAMLIPATLSSTDCYFLKPVHNADSTTGS